MLNLLYAFSAGTMFMLTLVWINHRQAGHAVFCALLCALNIWAALK